MKILVLVAHPDDEVIMCGATIDKLVKKGHSVSVAFYTHNDQAYFSSESQSKRRKRTVLEAKRSSEILGFRFNFLKFQDMEVEKNKGILIQKTIKEIRRVEPDIIITHHFGDKHIDHRTLGEVVPEANFQSGCNLCGGKKKWVAKAVLQGEVNLEMTTLFDFLIVSSVSAENIKNKLKAFRCYESVKNEHNTDQSWLHKKLEYSAQLRGRAVSESYGEAFSLNNYSPLGADSLEIVSQILKP
jgi:LmbE family N-acetylglucosaminyl deacetylase